MSDVPSWAMSHLEKHLPVGNPVVNATQVKRGMVLANTRLGAVLVRHGLFAGTTHTFLEVPSQKTAFRCAKCSENLQFYNLEIPADVFCAICASKYHVDRQGHVTDGDGKPVEAEFKPKQLHPFPPVRRAAEADQAREADANVANPDPEPAPKAGGHGHGAAYRHGTYTLYARETPTAGGGRTFYFFSKGKPKAGKPAGLPDGYVVGTNTRTGLPFLRKDPRLSEVPGEDEGEAAAEAKPASPGKLSRKQVAQRKYASRMKGVRDRAKTTRGGKGRIANRRTATRMRRELGLKDGN